MSLINQKFEVSATGAPEALAIPTHYLYNYTVYNYSGYWSKSDMDEGIITEGYDLSREANEMSPLIYNLEITPVVLNSSNEIVDMGRTFTHEVYSVYMEEKTRPYLEYDSEGLRIIIDKPYTTSEFNFVKYKIDDSEEVIVDFGPEGDGRCSVDVSNLVPTAHIIRASLGYIITRDDGVQQTVYNIESTLQFTINDESE